MEAAGNGRSHCAGLGLNPVGQSHVIWAGTGDVPWSDVE